jgi:ADP-L-glycero-D-manno-heptose 6-epimerase
MVKVWDESRVLVTGGAGFIGSALVWELNRRGCEQIVIADFLGTTDKWRNLAPLRFEDYLEADQLLSKFEAGNLGEFDVVLHLGACSSTTESDMTYLVRNNFEFTKQLALHSLWSGARFVYASSAATYGDGSRGMDDADERLDRLRPLNAYGYSKQLFDRYAQRHGWLTQIAGLKYFNIFGPNEDHKGDMRSLVHKSYGQIRDTGAIRLFKSYRSDYADGEQKRDFLYVKDAVDMTLYLAENESASGLFNIGGGEAHTWNELARAIFAALGLPPRIEYIDMPESLRDKYQYYTQANISKLRSSGYAQPITPLADAIRDYITQYLVPDRRLGDEDIDKS